MSLLRHALRAPLARSSRRPAMAVPAARSFMGSVDEYGKHLFKGAEADKYLTKHGLQAGALDDPTWTTTSADKVAAAVMEWAGDHGASVFTHWFQPLAASGVRLGMTGQVHNTFFAFAKDGSCEFKFKGKDLLKGETDGSSYPSGGMRATHTAGGYTVLDPTSPIFIKGDTVHVPSVFVSFYGDALDEKTPMMRSMEALNKEGVRLCKNLGFGIKGLDPYIGLEQEYFLVPRDAFYKRPDLQLTGRTVMGKLAPRGQEMCDHYMGPPNQLAMECIKEIQHECFKMGIPLRTRHREVAPNQYENAPLFGIATTQVDQNILAMQVMEEVSARHGLACLLQEKPFDGINGSGKHNNYSLITDAGINLLNCGDVAAASGSNTVFPVVISAMVRAVDKYGDLMRMSISSPGNDFRLGACEAPPAIVSTYLGDDLTSYLQKFKETGTAGVYTPAMAEVDLGIPAIAPFNTPAEDRNRTSPFPYGGHRFEFRAVGSAQNVSMVNTVLCTILADSFAAFSAEIEAGAKPEAVAAKALDEHWKVIFNGNSYSEEWPIEAEKRGVWSIPSGVEAMKRLSAPENIELFEKMKVMSKKEAEARTVVMYDHYWGSVEMEALTMIDMMKQHVIPSAKAAGLPTAALEAEVAKVKAGVDGIHAAETEYEKATLARVLRLEAMIEARAVCDATEAEVPANLWTLATYQELLFLDSNQSDQCAPGAYE